MSLVIPKVVNVFLFEFKPECKGLSSTVYVFARDSLWCWLFCLALVVVHLNIVGVDKD